jgi:flavin reductase (DIM6/NTAB) family NADH-FMN oxidoreductase RutF
MECNRTPISNKNYLCDQDHSKNPYSKEQEFIQLDSHGREYSRILYTNPVCFLSTTDSHGGPPKRNVMSVTWLSATNNSGKFMMSINSKRYTASLLTKETCFVLSVPVKGMEELVLSVGKTSGRWKSSKFPKDHIDNSKDSCSLAEGQKKKKFKFEHGIDGLVATKIGTSLEITDEEEPFAIQGTVAHLVCQSYKIFDLESQIIDNEHYLVMAQVKDAYVDKEYWDTKKKLFRPSSKANPYLTFFGSQTFGYVMCHDQMR